MKKLIIEHASEDFIRYGFKSFTMDDLAHKLGMSKKTLYEHYSTKNELIQACLDHFLEELEKNDCFYNKDGNIIEVLLNTKQALLERYKISTIRPLWELKKYYPKQYEKFDVKLRQLNDKDLEYIIERGTSEGFFRKHIDMEFIKAFFIGIHKLKMDPEVFPETKFTFQQVLHTEFEYLIRILVNENGLKELERVLALRK